MLETVKSSGLSQRREHVRRLLQVSATVHFLSPPGQQVVHLIDISKTGVAFASAGPIESGADFMLSFWLPGTPSACTVNGKVVYAVATGSKSLLRVGARLYPMTRATEDQIVDFISAPPALN